MDASTTLIGNVTNLTTGAAGHITSIFGDFLVVIILFALVFLLAWWVGKTFVVSFLLSLYVGYAIYCVFPYASLLPEPSPLIKLLELIGIYAIFCILPFFIIHKALVSDFITVGFFGLVILSLLGTGFLLALAFHSFPVETVYTFTPGISALFAPNQYFFWWFAAPLVGLFFFVR